MSKANVYVADSKIHGKGLFAARRIAEGEIIGELTGKWTSTDGPHVLWVDDKRGFHVQCDLKYINHSTTPNACYYDDLAVCALRDIEVGEEITHDYQSDGEFDE